MSEWNWGGEEERSSTIIRPVQAIAVYQNADGEIVIRQQSALGEDDQVIVFPKDSAEALIEAIKAEM